jgi:hypothetical protein
LLFLLSGEGLAERREMQGLERREERAMAKDRDGGACWLWCKVRLFWLGKLG